MIDHTAPRASAPLAGVTAEYGKYLAESAGCPDCHQADYAGGPVPGGPPDALPAPNLTPGGELVGWSEADFINTLRTGVTPGGRALAGDMPWKEFGQMTDDELKAIWLFLRSLPSKSTTSR